jgi:hypothetical protein
MLQYRRVFLAEQGIYYDEAMICFTVCKENIKDTLPFYSHTVSVCQRNNQTNQFNQKSNHNYLI